MIQIRQGTFETNSSSTHSLCIAKGDVSKHLPDRAWFDLDSYNWEHQCIDDTCSYYYTAIMDIYDGDLRNRCLDNLIAVLNKYHINATFAEPTKSTSNWYGIDHCDVLQSFLEHTLEDEDFLLRFLFHPESCVQSGNDNSYTEDDVCFCAEPRIFSEEEMKMIDNPLHDEEHFEYYMKDN